MSKSEHSSSKEIKKALEAFEKKYWGGDHKRFLDLYNNIEIAVFDLHMDLATLDWRKFGGSGTKIVHEPPGATQVEQWKAILARRSIKLGTIQDRRKELHQEFREFLKVILLGEDKQLIYKYIEYAKMRNCLKQDLESRLASKKEQKFQELKGISIIKVNVPLYRYLSTCTYPRKWDKKEVDISLSSIQKGTVNGLLEGIYKRSKKAQHRP